MTVLREEVDEGLPDIVRRLHLFTNAKEESGFISRPQRCPQQAPPRRWQICCKNHTKTNSEKLFARSEEHTSELQSLMRRSYAVLCLKKKKKLQYQKH